MHVQTIVLLGAAAAMLMNAAPAPAHHAFSTEFDSKLEGEVHGTVTRVWWANPHVRYAVTMTMPDGSTQEWMLQPPGNLPSYRLENWFEDTIKAGDTVRATGNLGRNGANKLYATCIELATGRKLGRCRNAGPVAEVIADPDVDYTVSPNDYAVDISGLWDNRYKFQVTDNDFAPKPMPLTPAAKTIYESRQFGDDDVLRCMPAGLPRIFGSPYAMQVLDAGTHYMFLSLQDNTPRWIWMDGRGVPDNYAPTSMGFSVGHWEDRTLVIETTHLAPAWLDGSGYPMSGGADTRIVERWTVADNGLTIDRTLTVHDKLYTAPMTRTRGSRRSVAENDLIESPPCDPDGYYRDLLERGVLEGRLR